LVGLGALNPNDTFSHPSFFGFGIVLSRLVVHPLLNSA